MAEQNQDLDNRRSFEHNNERFYIGTPTADDIKGADWSYSKIYTKSLTEGILTAAEMQDTLTRRGILGADYDMRREELEDILSSKILNLASMGSIEDKQFAALEVAKAREELFKWNQRASGPMSNTCEQIADDARLEYLTSRMIEHEDGNKVWQSYEDFCADKNQALTLACRFNVMVYLQGMSPDFLENTPEAIAMREVERELTDLAKEQAIVEETPEEPVEEPEKPKRTYKKKSPTKKATTKKKAPAKKKEADTE